MKEPVRWTFEFKAHSVSMLNLFLEWNAEDPVSALELQRNPIVETIQGNRNPFIDNPAFATIIWGGPQAEDRFGSGGGGGGGGNIAGSLSITLDNYPEETSWVIRNSSNVTVFSGGTYGNRADGSTFTVPVSLAPGCYTLVFSDTYGDGICCSYGNGSYTLTNQDNGSTLASGGSFGSSETSSFCVGSSLQSGPEATEAAFRANSTGETPAFALFPNPVDSQLSLRNFPEGAEYTILNASGQLVQQGKLNATIEVASLPAGAYQFMAVAGDWRVVKRGVKR